MAHVEGEIVINRPVDEVFDLVADERNEPRFNPRTRRVQQTSAGPIGVGTRLRVETTMLGRTVSMVIEFTSIERTRRLASATHMATMDIQGTLTFEPVPAGTRMRWSWELAPHGLLKLLSPLVTRIGQRQEATCWAGLKQFLEAEPAGQRGAGLASDRPR